ncbi:MAG: COX15/CtaA family protein [Terrimicrobiaceae bacterium]
MQPNWTFARAAVHWWAVFTAVLTFVLLCSGGLVTSHGVGMAVPDWPNTFGYNMFAFPLSRWVGGIFLEHSHRVVASFVGLFTAILAGWVWVRETRGSARWIGLAGVVLVLGLLGVREMPVYYTLAVLAPAFALFAVSQYRRDDGKLRWLVLIALAAVILQGVLGGLRVVWFKDEIGIFHGMLAQSFFAFLVILTVMTSRLYVEGRWADYEPNPHLRFWALGATALIFLQLGLGATMRHEHIGLAIPDFPLAYGAVFPDTSAEAVAKINAARIVESQMPTNAIQIWIQMAHRFVAGLIFAAVMTFFFKAKQSTQAIRFWSGAWVLMIFAQIGLGAWTIWSNKAADVATAHMALGALSLVVGAVTTFRLFCGARTRDFALPDRPNSRLMEFVA